MFPTPSSYDHAPTGGPKGGYCLTLRRSPVRESGTLGSVRAKAEWLRYSTMFLLRPERNL